MLSDILRVAPSYLKEARETGRFVADALKVGELTLLEAAEKMEVEARIWGQRFLSAILQVTALERLTPEQLEERSTSSARDITALAVIHFSVRCGPRAETSMTRLLIGKIRVVIETDDALEIDTRRMISRNLNDALVHYPRQYGNQKLAVPDRASKLSNSTVRLKSKGPDLEPLIQGKEHVGVLTAARYLTLSREHVWRLVRTRKLVRLGKGRPIKISTESLRVYKGT